MAGSPITSRVRFEQSLHGFLAELPTDAIVVSGLRGDDELRAVHGEVWGFRLTPTRRGAAEIVLSSEREDELCIDCEEATFDLPHDVWDPRAKEPFAFGFDIVCAIACGRFVRSIVSSRWTGWYIGQEFKVELSEGKPLRQVRTGLPIGLIPSRLLGRQVEEVCFPPWADRLACCCPGID